MPIPPSENYVEYDPSTGITIDGVHALIAPYTGTNYVLYAAGAFGSGAVTLGFIDSEDAFAPFKNVSDENVILTSSGGAIVTAPPSKLLAVNVIGSTDAAIKLTAIVHNR